MIIKTLFETVLYKLFLLLFSAFVAVNGAPKDPSTDNVIKADENAIATVAVIADPQIASLIPERYARFVPASKDLKNSQGLNAVLVLGDVAENGLTMEYQLFYDELHDFNTKYIACEGNHDIRLRAYSYTTKTFNGWLNTMNGDDAVPTDTFHYATEVNGIKFLVLGSDNTQFEENYLSPEQLKWVDDELKAQDGKLTFVCVHQPLAYTHGLPDVWGSPIKSAGSIGKQSDELKAILNKYDNIIMLSGHEHTAFGEYTYEQIDNFFSVNVPSLGANEGQGMVIEVFEDSVVFRARNMSTGEWLPEFDVTVPVK